LVNKRAVSSITYQSVRLKLHPQDMLTVSGRGVKVIAGGPVTDIFRHEAAYKEYRPEVQFFHVPGFSKVEYQFLVSGRGRVVVGYRSVKAGDITKEIDL